jgi:radical SAM superfamily enzyme YgiQ (UPF0313 family)
MAGIAKYIKNHYPDIYLIFGGPHASLNPDEVILSDCDALCIGEGEYPVLELVSQLEKGVTPSGIANLWIKQGSEVEKTAPRPFIQDLDSLPFPDREMWQTWLEERPKARHQILAGRGCPFQCTYCCNHALKKLSPGTYVRFRSAENIIAEISSITARFPTTDEIYLEIESFSINKEWAIELCSKLEGFNRNRRQPLSFGVNLRVIPNADLESLLVACKKSNFRFLNIGLESGSEKIRREVLKRNYSNEDIINVTTLARKYGLQVSFLNMIGIPGETIDDFKETVRMNRTCMPDWHQTSIFFPYPGTDLYYLCQEQGLIREPLDTKMERARATLNLPGFSRKQIQKCYTWFDYYVYKGSKPMFKILVKVLLSRLRSNAYIAFILRRISHVGFFKWLKNMLVGVDKYW